MTKERQKRFVTDGSDFLVRPKSGKPHRLDGQPLTAVDREILAGKDPVADQLLEEK